MASDNEQVANNGAGPEADSEPSEFERQRMELSALHAAIYDRIAWSTEQSKRLVADLLHRGPASRASIIGLLTILVGLAAEVANAFMPILQISRAVEVTAIACGSLLIAVGSITEAYLRSKAALEVSQNVDLRTAEALARANALHWD